MAGVAHIPNECNHAYCLLYCILCNIEITIVASIPHFNRVGQVTPNVHPTDVQWALSDVRLVVGYQAN